MPAAKNDTSGVRTARNGGAVEYKVVASKVSAVLATTVTKRTEDFTRQVNEHLRSGWEPVGGLAIGTAGSHAYLMQALIKRR